MNLITEVIVNSYTNNLVSFQSKLISSEKLEEYFNRLYKNGYTVVTDVSPKNRYMEFVKEGSDKLIVEIDYNPMEQIEQDS